MADEKKTQLGTLDPNSRHTGAAAAIAAPVVTPAPTGAPPDHARGHATSYLPPPPPQEDPLIGALVAGRYLISRKLGEGGMGAVYLATHNLLEKQVALKVLHAEFARKADLVERFIQEAKAASRIRHENVIDISDFGSTPEGQVFFAMELLKGHDLHEEVARARLAGELLPWQRSKKIFLQICSALAAAHDNGIIHRDLKPENIYLVEFLGEPDFVKLLDFGIAKMTEVAEGDRKLTRTGMLFGTPEYMSPEQARGETVDLRVDVYAMGCILFQLITGRVPFEAENFMGVLSMHLTEPPPQVSYEVLDRIGAPHAISAIIDRALLKDRNQRWQTITELSNAIRAACGDPIPTGASTTSMPSVRAPEYTTRPQTGQVPPLTTPPPTTQNRIKTQWTGNVSIPQEEDGGAGKRSKLPLILGGLAVVIAGVVVAFVMMNDNKTQNATTPTPGSAIAMAIDAGVVTPAATPDAPPAAVIPDTVEVFFATTPAGAEIIDAATGKPMGTAKTPTSIKIPGSATATRQFLLRKAKYSDSMIELVPNRARIEYDEILVKGAAGTVVKVKTPPTTGSGSAQTVVTQPDPTPGSGSAKDPEPGPGSAAVVVKPPPDAPPPPPEPECPPEEFPCLKKMPNDMPKQ